MTARRSTRDETGLLTTELAIMMPVMVVLALVAVFAINVQRHGSRAQQAADAAARAASLERTSEDARSAAQRAGQAVCDGTITIESFDFTPPQLDSFTPGRVSVSLTCTEQFSGFEPLVENSSRSESGTAVAAIEYWRSTT